MARTAEETANVLILMYEASFGGDELEVFRIGWPELRSLAGVPKLTKEVLADINKVLAETDYALIPFNDFLLVAQQVDFVSARQLPPRLLEQRLLSDEDNSSLYGEDDCEEGEEDEFG